MKRVFLLSLLLVILSSGSYAQQIPPVPVDDQVRTGQLDNGLTYYIRENKLPENRADFYIVQKVGSILEEENQRGLAHFLEHMAFNGTKNFPGGEEGRSIISYLETIGVKFGTNLNAGTGMDETIYNINDVPVTTSGAVESCLLILHDWSNALLLRENDIDKERKVIHEEWRTHSDASQRIIESVAPSIFKDSKYAHRMPIGLMSVVDNFEPQLLRDYYHKWYRPDLQGIIVVGDIDAGEIEKQIIEIFSPVALPENVAERVYEQIPDNDEPIVALAVDKELPMNNIMVAYKRDQVPNEHKTGIDYLVTDYVTEMIGQMLNERLQEMLQKSETPFAFAIVRNGAYFGVGTKDALQLIGVAKPGLADTTIATLMREVKRASDFGFTAGEYERAKANYLSGLEKLYNERGKQLNNFYVQQYVAHFLKNEPIPSIEDRYNMMNQLVPHIPLEAVNQTMQQLLTEKNRVVVLMGSEKEKDTYPSEDTIRGIIGQVDHEVLAAYEDDTVAEPLMATLPAKGSVIKEEADAGKGTTVWTLSNGAKVIVKPTGFKQDEILLHGFATGGTSVLDDQYIAEIKLMDDAASVGGLGNFSATALKRNLAGKNAEVSFKADTFNEQVNGKSSVKDLETMMQLLWLNFTDVRNDDEAWQSLAGRLKGILPTLLNNPDFVFADSLMNTIYMRNPRFSLPTLQEIETADYGTLLDLYRSRFENTGNFTFTFVGNISPEELKPLVEQYIASLPGTTSGSQPPREIATRQGACRNHFSLPMETPKASTAIIYTGEMAYTPENIIKLDALGQLFRMEFTEKIREEEGGTYGVRVHQEAEKLPREGFTLQFQFDTDPARRDGLVEAMDNITAGIRQKGPDAGMVQKVKEYMLKQHADDLKKNEYALRNTWQYYVHGIDLETDWVKQVNDLSSDTLRQFAEQLFGQDNRIEVSMTPR
ncbi:insulinase family protein [Proteiniphilum sp.]|uniref:M16 family metallopeptidase n=1 Tax=Proteiniphilum sp. TaxID=1926877 RepID=UPI00332032F8